MRDDYKYPYRVTTRTEERELNDILYGLISLPFILPLFIIDRIVEFIFTPFIPSKYQASMITNLTFIFYICLLGIGLDYLGWLTPVLNVLSYGWDCILKDFF
tara:strand:- start:82 stop:387 length:306 start_codon:yes stop_codon:yes gene_type:complete